MNDKLAKLNAIAEDLGIVELDERLDLSIDPFILAAATPVAPVVNSGNCGNCHFLC